MKIEGSKTYDQIHNKYSFESSRSADSKQFLQKGELLRGEIIDLNQNSIKIRLANGEIMEAKMTEVFDFFIGQKLEFMVRAASEEQLLLSPLLNEENIILDKLMQILKDAGINVNSNNISIVNQLLENNLPVDKESLISFIKLTKKFLNANTEELTFLLKNKIPITEGNILQLQKIQTGRTDLGDNLLALADDLTFIAFSEEGEEFVQIALSGNPKGQEILQSMKQLLMPFTQNASEEQTVITEASPKEMVLDNSLKDQGLRLKLSQPLNELLTGSEIKTLEHKVNMAIFNKPDVIRFDEKTVAELFDLPNILKLSDSLADEVNQVLRREITKNILANEIFMNIQDIKDPQRLNLYYNELKDKIENLLTLEKKSITESDKPLSKEIKDIQNSIDFMKDMNQKFNYLQLPILQGEKPLNCELYVMNDKKAKKDKDSVSAFIRLEMVHLGLLDIFLTKIDKDVQIQFYVEDEEKRIVLQDKIYNLYSTLQKGGFHVLGISVVKREKEIDVMKDFLEEDREVNEVKRYTFDMRA